MSITYTPSTNFGAKDSLPTNDSNKVIRGSEFTTEFVAIQTAFSNAAPTASPTFTGTVTISSVDINGGAIDGTTIGGTTPAAGSFTTLNATGGGALTGTWTDLGSVTTVDINGGTIDGVTIGGSSAGAINGTTIDASTQFQVGTNDSIFAENNLRFKPAGAAYIDHNTVGQSINFRLSNASSLDTTAVTIDSSGNTLLQTGGAALQWQNGYQTITGDAASNDLTYRTYQNHIWKNTTGASSTTDGSEAMRIDSSGNLLVGTTSNAGYGGHVLQKDGSGLNSVAIINSATSTPYGPYIYFSGASPNDTVRYFVNCSDSTTVRAVIRSNGGFANYQANDANLSDERVKTDIAPLGSMWDKFKALEIVTFKYKDQTHDDDNIGVIAQQVEAVAPEFVDNDGFGETPEGEEPLKAIYTADLYHAAIKALQEAMARIETLEAEVAALKGA